MRILFLFITIIFLNTISYCQEKKDTVSVYYQALKCYVEHIDEFNKDSLMHKELYFEYLRGISYKLPNKILGYKIIFLDDTELKSILRKRKGIPLRLFFPLEEENGKFSIAIQGTGVNKRGNKIIYSISTGYQFVYSFDCFQKKWILEKMKNFGP